MKQTWAFISLFLVSLLSGTHLSAQKDSTLLCPAVIENGDTIGYVILSEATVIEEKKRSKRYIKRYNRLESRIVKVYPYATAAGELMAQYDSELAKIKNKKDQKEFIELAEDELKKQFEGDLKDMSVTEGIILIKLIDRQTGDTSYELIKELKGNFSAFMWQGVARLFGHNLKDEYEGEGDDEIIEDVVRRIEAGEIKVGKREVHLLNAELH